MSKVNVNPPDQEKAQEMIVPNETGEPNDVKDLTVFVETLLQQMQEKFQNMSDQIINRIDEMGSRIDDLEKNIGELMSQAGVDEPEK
ncbi:heat shock factor-binding protein 1-like [Xenia sp. Carnegie-2017]|uniref:heat shock factor-binding protein 1-like n=1 Tax=Xenia sp. Carnegie-2017 TaxID=2897299 RepID=UPI001F03DB8B|nr:heat shock factor-binding protein 1-like [Xenia sp. Carnegie-2017]